MKNKDPWDELTTDAGPRYNNLTIDRSKWLRGGNIPVGVEPYHTCLLNEKGDMCPMGFHMCALGFPEEFIKNVGEPSELEFEELFDDGVLQSPGGQELRRGAGWMGTELFKAGGPAFQGRYPDQHPQMKPLLTGGDRVNPKTGQMLRIHALTPYEALEYAHTKPAGAIVRINDDKEITDDEREFLLTKVFEQELGITLTFTGRPPGEYNDFVAPQGEE